MMLTLRRSSAFLSLSILLLCACKASTQSPASLTTVAAPQGGKIVYGAVSGASTQSAVLTGLLARVHNLCGEKPQIGRVFQFKGTNSVGVFFTVTDHPEGNIPLAGMVIATATGPSQAEGAMIYDVTSRFGTTVNPMLQQLSGVWHPGGEAAASGPSQAGAGTASASGPANGAQSAPAASLRRVTLSDNTASVGVPNGWSVTPGCRGGTISLSGPHGEVIDLALGLTAEDPTNRFVQQSQRSGGLNASQGKFVSYPYNVDLAKAFPAILDQMRRIGGVGSSANAQISKAEQIPAPQGERCVHVSGHIAPAGMGSYEIDSSLCTTAPGPDGMYGITLFHTAIPVAYADQERATAHAIVASFQQNTALLKAQVAAATGPVIAAMNKQIEGEAAQAIGNIHQIGAATTARINAGEAASGAQQASWEAGQTANAQNAQGFSNYLLDQSVVQNNTSGAQGTLWNNAANALVQSNPNKYSYVSNPNLLPGSNY